jgi:CHAT domain-containing protein
VHFVFSLLRFALAATAFLVLAATAAARLPAWTVNGLTKPNHAHPAGRSLNKSPAPQKDSAPPLVLRAGETVQREIKDGETQVLSVPLLREQYAQVTFTWKAIDLDVQVLKPNGTPAAGSAGQVRGARSLPVPLMADEDGEYRLVVRPAENLKTSGSFSVILEAPHAPRPTDRKRIEAGKLLAEAQKDTTKESAAQKLLQALELWNDIGETYGASYTLHLLGSLFLPSAQTSTTDISQPPDAEEFYRRAIELVQNLDPLRFAYTLLDIGSDHQRFISPKAALTYYQQSLKIFREYGDRRGEGAALYSIGLAQANIGDMEEALKWLEPALVAQRAVNDRLGEGRTLNAIGGAYNVLADQERALGFYQQAALIWQELDDRYREAITNQNIGLIYDDWGDFQRAKDKYSGTLAVYKTLLTKGDLNSCRADMVSEDARICNSIANTLDNIGELYNSLGDPQAALDTLRDSLTIRKTVNQPRGLGATLSRIGYAYLLENNPSEALSYCEQALPFSEKAKDRRKVGSILAFTGMAYAALNKADKALEYYQQALRVQEETGERRGLGITLDQMGRAYASRNDVTRAFESYNRALAIWREIKDEEWETRTLYNLANAEHDRGDLLRAHEQIEKGLQIVESRRTLLSSQKLRTSYFANKEDMYELDIDLRMQLSKTKGLSKYATSALETSEKTRARLLIDLLSEANAGRKLALGVNQRSDQKLVELVERKQSLQSQLNAKGQAQTILLSGKHTQERAAAIAKELGDLSNEYDEVERQIRERSLRYAELTKSRPVSLAQIQQHLDDDTLLLEYSLGDKRSYVWAVTPNSIEVFDFAGRKEIEGTAKRMISALTERNRRVKDENPQQRAIRLSLAEDDYSKSSMELSKMVIHPVAALLRNKRLVIVADGALQFVPFQALPNPQSINPPNENSAKSKTSRKASSPNSARPLVEDHEIVYQASASVLALQRKELGSRQPARRALAVLADPVFDQEGLKRELGLRRTSKARDGQGQPDADATRSSKDTNTSSRSDLTRAIDDMGIGSISSLPQSREEADAIMRLVPKGEGMAALGFDASRATAMSPDLSQFRIVHFATHGFANFNHPELSGIVLSLVDDKGQPQDGYLSLQEIYNLNLPADLVVLSACQTAVGKQIKGEGLIALTRGFMYAGAQRVVASLWKVDDEATRELMQEFYGQMFTNKLKPAAALRAAQRKLSHQSQWRSPYYWAGFVLQGEWK